MTFTTWKAMDDKSYVGSDSDYRYYRVTKGAYRSKLGLALVKLPNQPVLPNPRFSSAAGQIGRRLLGGEINASNRTYGNFREMSVSEKANLREAEMFFGFSTLLLTEHFTEKDRVTDVTQRMFFRALPADVRKGFAFPVVTL